MKLRTAKYRYGLIESGNIPRLVGNVRIDGVVEGRRCAFSEQGSIMTYMCS